MSTTTESIAPALAHARPGSDPGYQAAVTEESHSHDDVTEQRHEVIDHRFNRLLAETIAAQYRDLVGDCTLMQPDFSGFTDVSDLPDLTLEDLALIGKAKGLETSSTYHLKHALLADVQAECELQNERRAEARDQYAFERFHGGDSPFNEREQLEVELGMGRTFR